MICRLLATRCCHLLQQHVLFPQQLLHLPLYGAPVGNVLECQQDGGVGALLVENLARVEQHDAMPDRGELALDLISFDRRLIFCDRFQKIAKLRDVPLTAVDLIKQLAANIFAHEPKGLVEGPARRR